MEGSRFAFSDIYCNHDHLFGIWHSYCSHLVSFAHYQRNQLSTYLYYGKTQEGKEFIVCIHIHHVVIQGRVKGTTNKFKPIHEDPNEIEHLADVLIIRIDEPLFFVNTGQLKDRLRRLELFGDMSIHPSESRRLGDSSYIIFDVGSMPYVDAR